MIWFLGGAILVIVLIIATGFQGGDRLTGPMKALAVGVVGTVFAILASTICSNVITPEYEVSKMYDIVSLDTANATSKYFVLGTGSIDQEPYYFYCDGTQETGYTLERVPANEATIFEWDRDSAEIIEKTPSWGSLIWSTSYSDHKDIYLPRGFIIREFSPDAR